MISLYASLILLYHFSISLFFSYCTLHSSGGTLLMFVCNNPTLNFVHLLFNLCFEALNKFV